MKKNKTQTGQSLLEFVMCMLVFVTSIFMVVQVTMGFGVANYIQYATFMAARALLSGGDSFQSQQGVAQAVIERMVRTPQGLRFKPMIGGISGGSAEGEIFVGATTRASSSFRQTNARNMSWEQGVTFRYSMKMYMLPIIKGSKTGAANTVELTSESWLGREPSQQECLQKLGSTRLIDNGC